MRQSSYPLLSVVMSVYNDCRFLQSAIDSILNQTYKNFEFIIVNDGSTDDSEKLIKSYKDPRIIYISKPNTGLADSLNVGIQKSTGEWIVRMDADDISLSHRLQTLVDSIDDKTEIIGSNAIYFDNNEAEWLSNMPLESIDIRNAIIHGKPSFIHPTVMFKRSFIKKANGYDRNFTRAQDQNLWIRSLALQCHYKNISLPLLKYRFSAKPKHFNYQAILCGMADTYIFYNNCSRTLTSQEFGFLKHKIERLLAFKISYLLSNFLHTPILKYLYPVWCKTRIPAYSIKKLANKIKLQ